tara:strand:- start:814 stop:1935 length:1122 start_codon:yes stop_codon:yes gene_type:complete
MKLNTIKEAIEDLKNNKVIIVVDDENRENEGDFIYPAEIISPDIVNFMATHGRGLICVPLTSKRCKHLKLDPMVSNNTELMQTAFTISVDLIGDGVTSGISASDRSKTINALVNEKTKPSHLARPGHIFPLSAKDGGVLRRTGHTEAAVDLSRLAGFKPAGVLCEIMNKDGTMARLPDLFKVAKKFDLKIISIEKLVSYRMKNDSLIDLIDEFNLKTLYGEFNLNTFKQKNNDQIHLALSKGNWLKDEPVLCRVNSFGSINNSIDDLVINEDPTIKKITKKINKQGKGVIVFVNQDSEAKPILNNINHLKKLQKCGKDFKPYKKMDAKDFGIGAQILHKLNVSRIRLLTTKDRKIKRVGMAGYGLKIIETVNF